jgi:nitrate/nitrite transporter NarK
MIRSSKENRLLFLLIVGLLAWLVPGAGHFVLKEKKRSIIIFVTILLTFCTGLYVGSIGVIDPVRAKPWYVAQIMNSPMVAALGHLTATGGYRAYGWPNEVGQIYTSTAGLLNLLCIVNAVYLAYLRSTQTAGE